MASHKPIAALSSGHGPGGVAVIRVSGKNCHEIVRGIFRFKTKPQEFVPEAAKLYLGELFDPETKVVIDEPLVVFFYGPHSFTGEESAEIHLHGGPWIISRTLELLYSLGVLPAEPGEFTRRAFEHGKLDLTRAEGIKALVEATSEQEWIAARQLATGRLHDLIEDLRKKMMDAMAWLEATIDFPDEGDTETIQLAHVNDRVHLVELAIDRLLQNARSGQITRSGLQVVLVGEPNAGKSTLMNTLLGENRAIVTAIPGTTRDYLEEKCLINGRLIRLIDTAGIRKSSDEVEIIGIERSLEIAKKSDLVLFLHPADHNDSATHWLEELRSNLTPGDYIEIETKSDILGTPEKDPGRLRISAKTGSGLEQLKKAITERVDKSIGTVKDQAFVTEPRHLFALNQAKKSIAAFKSIQENGAYVEMQAFELLEATRALSSIIGHIDSDDILGVIFSSFCVGK